MTNRKLSSSPRGANRAIPESVTTLFIEKIQSLSPSIKTDYLKAEFLSKFMSSDTDPAELRRARAIEKWLECEKTNATTNERLLCTVDEYTILPYVTFLEFIEWTRILIEETIGAVPPWDSLIGEFSGGASTSRNRNASHPTGKYLGKAHVTAPALDIFRDLILEDMPGWASFGDNLVPEVVTGNVMFTVPKKTDIDRVACKEPDINMFLQKGLGNVIRRGLRRKGINLNDQSINQSLALRGSIDGSLATIDLSSASDSVTWGLVQLLMPECWFTLLDNVRSPLTIIDGETHKNEMFSSMGNGFTFELESLLFWSLAKATARFCGVSGRISVYGDDIIVPSSMAEELVTVLNYFGFRINASKSFWEGPFRESCGGHYSDGNDITPFYLRAPMTHLTDVIHMANSFRLWSSRDSVGGIHCDWDYEDYPLWSWLQSYIPEDFWGGRDYSDKSRLVTHHAPRRRLVPVKQDPIDTGDGGYIFWLNLTYKRTFQTCVETSSREEELLRYRSRPVRETVTSLATWFREELG